MPKDTHNRMPNGGSISESLVLSLLLSFSGGFQDAYTYVVCLLYTSDAADD